MARFDDDIAEEEEEKVDEEVEGGVDNVRALAGVAVEVGMVVAVDYSKVPHRAEDS